MAKLADLTLPEDPQLAINITYFVRSLRRAGLPVGPGHVVRAVQAVAAVGFTERTDFYWTLHSVLVTRPEDAVVYDTLFRLFWRDPRYHDRMMAMLMPSVRGVQEERELRAAETRAADALLDGQGPEPPAQDQEAVEVSLDSVQTASGQERLQTLDFDQMTAAELAEARRLLHRLPLPVPPMPARRFKQGAGQTADARRTIARAASRGGEIQRIETKRRTARAPSLVVLCDISGSMTRYSRAVLQFVHGVANGQGNGWGRVHAFTFGTQLTNITRHLARKDVDEALAAAGHGATDWDGGTRIGESLDRFNRDWSRRVLGQGAVVLLVTDGLERDDTGQLAPAAERLRLSCRRLIWVNPLLRFDGYAPKAAGARALLPNVDVVIPGHNIESFSGLADALASASDGQKRRLVRLLRAPS